MKQPQNQSPRLKRSVLLGILLLLTWMGLVVPMASHLTIAAILAAIMFAIHWKSITPLAILILCPFSVWFLLGITEWFHEKPRFHYKGLPGYEFYNLDRETRCYNQTGGCLVYGNEWIYQQPHNAGLHLMATIFGPPRNAYTGPYPTKDEAIKLTDNAPDTPPELFLKDTVLINGEPFPLKPKTSEIFLSDFRMIFFGTDLTGLTQKVQAYILDHRCLLIRVSMKEAALTGDVIEASDGIVLFDLANLKAFARYVIEGEYAQRIPTLLIE